MTERERFHRPENLFDEQDEPSDEQLPPRPGTPEADSDRWAPGKAPAPLTRRFADIARETFGRAHSDADLSAPSPVKGLSMREFLTRQVDIARLATMHRRRESARNVYRQRVENGKQYIASTTMEAERASEREDIFDPAEVAELVDRALTAVPSSLIAIQSIEGGE